MIHKWLPWFSLSLFYWQQLASLAGFADKSSIANFVLHPSLHKFWVQIFYPIFSTALQIKMWQVLNYLVKHPSFLSFTYLSYLNKINKDIKNPTHSHHHSFFFMTNATVLLAARRGALFARELGLRRVVLEGDLEFVINSVRSGSKIRSMYGHLIKDVFSLVNSFQSISFSHCYIQGNAAGVCSLQCSSVCAGRLSSALINKVFEVFLLKKKRKRKRNVNVTNYLTT